MTGFYIAATVLIVLLVLMLTIYSNQYESAERQDLDMNLSIDLDEYRNYEPTYTVKFDGENYMVLRDGEEYITCLGSKADAENIVNTLMNDARGELK